MRRGDLVLVREPGTPASKARPYVVIQRDSSLQNPAKFTGCPLTSHLRGVAGERPLVMPSPQNGLRTPSEVQIDWVYTHPVGHLGPKIGYIEPTTMAHVDAALRRWFAL